MKRRIIFIFLLSLIIAQNAFSQKQKKIWDESESEKKERLAWWTDARFGMFIHWGLYAQAARHEWVKNTEHMSNEEYNKYFDVFNPDLFAPEEWAKKAKAAGMKYAVITCKHHEGFCMFKSDYTDYNVTNTPYGRDIIKEWVEAFRKEGLKVGFYYSLLDWHHPDYTIDVSHPQKPEREEDYAELNKTRDMSVYREYLKNQVREILTNYGKIDILWLDYSFPGKYGKGQDDWGAVELMKMVRKLQPQIIVNDRADLKDYKGGWDFTGAEQYKTQKWLEVDGKRVPWETCHTLADSWGYYRDEYTWKDNKQLLELLIESVSKGGNVLLNVGPTARGYFDYRADAALEKIGKWMKYNSRSIYGCTQAPDEFNVPEGTRLTYNPSTRCLYIHLIDYPTRHFVLHEYKDKIKYAQFLHDASELQILKTKSHFQPKTEQNDVTLVLPVVKPKVEIPVIEVFLR